MNGIINVNKPIGFTSHDVVARLRKILNTRKIGHTGTLDPDATGVLPVCVGQATKAVELLSAKDKQYEAQVRLGAETDTQDASGRIICSSDAAVTEEEVFRIVRSFVGEGSQIPPMYSAIKQNGKKLYELARAGVEVERQPRKIYIHRIEVLSMDLENRSFSILVDCSKGTYIRTLCQDIGRKLGCFAHMSALCRTRSGQFDLKNALTLEQIEDAVQHGDSSFFIPVDQVFSDMPALYLSERKAEKMCHGVQVSTPGMNDGVLYRVYNEKGKFLSVSRAENGVLKLVKTFFGTENEKTGV